MKRILAGAACAAVLVLSAACSSTDGPNDAGVPGSGGAGDGSTVSVGTDELASAAAEVDAAPACSDVWVDGAKIAADYTQCTDGDTVRLLSALPCQDGTQLASDDEDHAWAVVPGAVHVVDGDIAADKAYAKAYAACNG